MKFVKPELVDDWGTIGVFLGPIVKSRWGTVAMREQTAPKIETGRYRVRWPDGTEEDIDIEMVKTNNSVSDHGHTYPVTQHVPYIRVDHHGASLSIKVMDAVKAGLRIAVPE